MIEKIFSILLFIISVLGYNMAKNFKNSFMIDEGLGAGFFPQTICIILGVLSLLILLKSKKEDDYKFSKDNKSTFLVMGVCIVYVLILNKLGYLISTGIFSFLIIKILNKNNLLSNIIFSSAFTVIIYFLFSKVFSVSLPVLAL